MHRARPRTAVTRALLASFVLMAASGLPAGTAWAARGHRGRATTTTTTPVTTVSTTTTVLPPPSAPPASAPDNCVNRAWPGAVQGRPASYQAGENGAYLWLDPDGGWALRVVHGGATGPKGKVIFSGTLTMPKGRFLNVQGAGAGNDIVAVSPNGRTVLFRFVNFGQVDGLSFATHCSSAIKVNIHMDGSVVPVANVHLGSNEAGPATNPFRVVRGPAGVALSEAGQGTVPETTSIPA